MIKYQIADPDMPIMSKYGNFSACAQTDSGKFHSISLLPNKLPSHRQQSETSGTKTQTGELSPTLDESLLETRPDQLGTSLCQCEQAWKTGKMAKCSSGRGASLSKSKLSGKR